MSLHNIILYFFMALSAVAAVGILFSKNIFKSALFLLTCLVSLAALYVFSMAEFLAAAQLMIYAGGIIIVIIFGIMLTSKLSGDALKVTNSNLFIGGLLSVSVLMLLLRSITSGLFTVKNTAALPEDTVSATGIALMSSFILPFEVIGIVLLAALIGAAVIASLNQREKRS